MALVIRPYFMFEVNHLQSSIKLLNKQRLNDDVEAFTNVLIYNIKIYLYIIYNDCSALCVPAVHSPPSMFQPLLPAHAMTSLPVSHA